MLLRCAFIYTDDNAPNISRRGRCNVSKSQHHPKHHQFTLDTYCEFVSVGDKMWRVYEKHVTTGKDGFLGTIRFDKELNGLAFYAKNPIVFEWNVLGEIAKFCKGNGKLT